MAKKGKIVSDPMTIKMVGSDEKPEGEVFTEWDILFEENISIKKKDQIIARLLNKIAKYKVKDKTITTSLKYQSFKSKNNENLHILRVYREFKRPTASAKQGKGFKPLAAFGGPIRTPGPPVPTPPPAFVLTISDIVGLNEDPPTEPA